jgi:hypothetical protein
MFEQLGWLDIAFFGGPFVVTLLATLLARRYGPLALWGVLIALGLALRWHYSRLHAVFLANGGHVVDQSYLTTGGHLFALALLVAAVVDAVVLVGRWPIWAAVLIAGLTSAAVSFVGYMGFGAMIATALTALWLLVRLVLAVRGHVVRRGAVGRASRA